MELVISNDRLLKNNLYLARLFTFMKVNSMHLLYGVNHYDVFNNQTIFYEDTTKNQYFIIVPEHTGI